MTYIDILVNMTQKHEIFVMIFRHVYDVCMCVHACACTLMYARSDGLRCSFSNCDDTFDLIALGIRIFSCFMCGNGMNINCRDHQIKGTPDMHLTVGVTAYSITYPHPVSDMHSECSFKALPVPPTSIHFGITNLSDEMIKSYGVGGGGTFDFSFFFFLFNPQFIFKSILTMPAWIEWLCL